MKCSSAAVRLEHAAAHAGQSGDRHAAHGVVATCRNTSSAASSSCVPTFGPVASMRPGTPQPSSSCWCGGCARPGPRCASSSEAIRGCCRQLLINWCERAGVHYIIGLARNPKLEAIVECAQLALHEQHERTGPKLANTQIDTLRIRLLKLAAVVHCGYPQRPAHPAVLCLQVAQRGDLRAGHASAQQRMALHPVPDPRVDTNQARHPSRGWGQSRPGDGHRATDEHPWANSMVEPASMGSEMRSEAVQPNNGEICGMAI